MIGDFYLIISWWFLLFGLGLVFLPLSWLLFRQFFDFGYPFAKILGILFLSYLIWLFGNLHLLTFNHLTVWLTIFILFLGNIFIFRKNKKEIIQTIKLRWKTLVFEEILFFVCLALWSLIRGFQPDIEGLEKFMDFGFVNSILRSSYFPPADIWLAGKTINYYYFGHLVAAVLTKLSGIDSAITYNLMIATIFALAFTGTFSLTANLISQWKMENGKWKIFATGLLSAALLTLGGNLHAFWWFLTNKLSFTGYWYPDATRFIVEKFGAADNTIHEFPIYSFVVSDLHGHVSNIPFVLFFLALLFAWFSSHQGKTLITNYQLLIAPLVLAVMYMTNSWDFPIYFLVLNAVILWSNYQKHGLATKTFYQTFLFSFFIFIFSVLFSLPFHLHFSQIAQGILLVNAHSPFWQLFVLWGYQWAIAASFLSFLIIKIRITNYKLLITDIYILILLAVATLLIIIPEIFYVKDIYIASYHRANTMFKLVYQSFMLYALASGYIILRLLFSLRKNLFKFLFVIFIFSFLFFIFLYPYFAVKSYYGLKTYRGLEGLDFIRKSAPDDYAGILWLKQNIKGQPIVLEAVGDSYTDYNRVSSLTGLPTIQGWLVHEWLWRGSFNEPGKRAAEAEKIFTSDDRLLVQQLLKQYQVKYIFIGSKEREKYQVNEETFKNLGNLVFSQGNTRIYQFP